VPNLVLRRDHEDMVERNETQIQMTLFLLFCGLVRLTFSIEINGTEAIALVHAVGLFSLGNGLVGADCPTVRQGFFACDEEGHVTSFVLHGIFVAVLFELNATIGFGLQRLAAVEIVGTLIGEQKLVRLLDSKSNRFFGCRPFDDR
jgi:hypothetical protein